MKNIKYRVWNKNKKQMRPVRAISFAGKSITTDFDTWYFKNCELMQWTGLNDRLGKEIYEGDILLHFDKKYIVEWSEEMAAFQSRNPKDDVDVDFFNWGNIPSLETKGVKLMFDGRDEGNCEIIGNIYENPGLLVDKAHAVN